MKSIADEIQVYDRDFLVFDKKLPCENLHDIGYKSRWTVFDTHEERKRVDAGHDLWFTFFDNNGQVDTCKKLFKHIEDKAVRFVGTEENNQYITNMLNGDAYMPIKLETEAVYDLRRGLQKFKRIRKDVEQAVVRNASRDTCSHTRTEERS